MALFQRIKFLNIKNKDTRKVSLQYLRDEGSRILRGTRLVHGIKAWFLGTLLNVNSDRLRLDIIERLSIGLSHTLSGSN